jgi:ubiquinone/menaquinone biosynthesis C-methylase UbiE
VADREHAVPFPQAAQMADPSMVRTLSAQAEAIWPQEAPLFLRYGLAPDARILDAGCGTGEASLRLADLYPGASIVGVDVLDVHLDLARARARERGVEARVRFEHRSIFALGLPGASFDLVACRHVLQAVPGPERAVAELRRVTRPGGWLHLIAEDYAMIHFSPGRLDAGAFWPAVPAEFGRATGTDMLVGRRAPGMLRALGLEEIAVDYVVVDTVRVPRETFAAIWTAWRDGYADTIGQHTSVSAEQARAHFDDQIATIRDPGGYAAWFVPVVSGRVPRDV